MIQFIKLRYKLFLVLLAFWFLLAFNFQIETVISGIVVTLFITIVASYNVLYTDEGYVYHGIRLRTIVVYIVFLFVEIYKAAFMYVYNLMSHRIEPVVFTIELDVDDPVLVGVIANSITLTPGTITIDSDSEKRTVTVLTLAEDGISSEDLAKPIREKFEALLKKKGIDVS